MDIKNRIVKQGIPENALNEINRVISIFDNCRKKYGAKGEFLLGDCTIADAMFAPVVTRFITYGVSLPESAKNYCDTMMKWQPMKEWCGQVK